MNRTNIFMERKAGKGRKWGEGRLQELNGQGADLDTSALLEELPSEMSHIWLVGNPRGQAKEIRVCEQK